MKKSQLPFYDVLSGEMQSKANFNSRAESFDISATVCRLRKEKKMTGVELCRRAGDLDPRTLTALEKGRIKNPSIQTLQSLSRGLNIAVSDLFRKAEIGMDRYFYTGSPKGFCHIDFPSLGMKVVSFTPLVKDFFCGKFILAPRKRLDHLFMKHASPIYISVLIGCFEVCIEEKSKVLKEGENLFFNGYLKHSFLNPLERESVLMLMTAPSFLMQGR